ncbi:MAG TPA: lantibiotic dehydratase [Bacteroidales bacterium]|nr:lantibiotic dehydratase [Bacteroidales bacterium]HPS18033.1 lantibiotic dehydratase [Bacteroidales bacterium]
MLDEIKKQYQSFSNFLIRTPLLPLQTIEEFTEEKLKNLFQNPVIGEAIFLASPVLHSECIKWLNGNIKEKKEERRIVYSLMRYLLRMSTRCTPFGLFAGCTVGEWKETYDVRNFFLQSCGNYKSHTRLDMHYLCALAQNLSNHSIIKDKIKFFPNSSIYKYGNKIRYVEYRYVNKKRLHHLVAVDDSDYLRKILSIAENGAEIKVLAESLVDDEINIDEATDFINELISSQILVSELEPAITGPEFLQQLLKVLEKIEGIDEIKNILSETKNAIEKIDESQLGVDVLNYYNIAENLKKLKTEYELNLLFQTDMVKPAESVSLDNSFADDVLKGIAVMNKFTLQQAKNNLTQFCEAFYERYEDKEVPLVLALDNETGIGYLQGSVGLGDIAPLVDDIGTPSVNSGNAEIQWNSIQSFLLKKYLEAHKTDSYEVNISDKELEIFKNDFDDLPDTISAMVQLYHDKIYISSVGGSSAANLLGRFCHSGESIYQMTRKITEKEKSLNPDVIYAEIVHLPESRTGNILLRPALREYEIPFLAKANVDKEHQISLNDLMLSVRSNKIFLRSRKLNKEIIPRLSTAHNYSYNSLPIYHFLCDLQMQNSRGGVGFSWGVLQNEFTFLPRVCYQNVILSLAQWNLRKEDFEKLLKYEENNLLNIINEWREKFKMPRYIALADGDNELVIDLENILCVKTFIDAIKKRQSIKLIEFIFDSETSVVKSEEGSFANQVIIPFYKIKEIKQPEIKERQKEVKQNNNEINIQRTYTTGDRWLYFKFYMGSKTSDLFLTNIIKPLTEELIQEQIIDKWFFIRYADPKLHIRIRFHGTKENFYSSVIAKLHEYNSDFINMNLTWKVQTDTYNRELERYGYNSIDLAESLFFHDSSMIVKMLDMIEGDQGETYRWLFCVRAIDTLLDDFKFDMMQKKELLHLLSEGFNREFNMNKDAKAHLGQKYRKERSLVNEVLDRSKDEANEMKPLIDYIIEKSNSIKPIVEEILKLKENNTLQVPIDNLMGSYIHMLCNRLFKSKQRLHELVIYTFLLKYYESEIAREKTST